MHVSVCVCVCVCVCVYVHVTKGGLKACIFLQVSVCLCICVSHARAHNKGAWIESWVVCMYKPSYRHNA